MEINEFITRVKEKFPEQAIELRESLELIQSVLSETVELAGASIENVIRDRKFEKLPYYTELAEHGYNYEEKIEQVMGLLEMEESEVADLDEETTEGRQIPNYEEYRVDHRIEHSLLEDFRFKRPYGFKLNEDQDVEAKTWKEMLVRFSEILYALDKRKFLSFEHDPTMNGRRKRHFSKNEADLRDPQCIGGEIFIETHHSANTIRNFMIKMLSNYDFKISDFRVYYRADYTNMNR